MFGWNNLRLPDVVYASADIVLVSAVVGLIWLLGRRPSAKHVGVLLLWALIFPLSLVRWVEVNADAAQWRLLFPAFPAPAAPWP